MNKYTGKITKKVDGGYEITDHRNRTSYVESSTSYKLMQWVLVLNGVIVSKATKIPEQVSFSV